MSRTLSAETVIDPQRVRAHFPALAGETVFLENAGGSQVPAVVAERIRQYMLESYVQLEADYELSRRATALVEEAHDFINLFMNGVDTGTVILGPSCTQLCRMLAECYAPLLDPGDEIIIAETGHEANVGPWVSLAEAGDGRVTLKVWPVDPGSFACSLEALEGLLGSRTRLVALPHVSNLLGEIVDVKAITELAHRAGARVVVDGVAYAPHRAIDVAAWDVDWYVYSTYKVYGPHMAALYGRHDAVAELTGPNHFFIPEEEVPYKFEPGGVSHEGCAGLVALGDYLLSLTGRESNDAVDRTVIEEAFAIATALERPLQDRLIEYLRGKPRVRVIGPAHAEASRVGTISFVHETHSSREISDAACERNIGIRFGHMYAYRLCEALELDPDDGVVRVSLVHYNTLEEIDRLIEVFEAVL